MKKIISQYLLLLLPELCFAANQEIIDQQIMNAEYTIAAFECSILAIDPIIKNKFTQLGYEKGHEFIAYIEANYEQYEKKMIGKISNIWSMVDGPSADFILGRVYQDSFYQIAHYYQPDQFDYNAWLKMKVKMYQQKNCHVLHYRK